MTINYTYSSILPFVSQGKRYVKKSAGGNYYMWCVTRPNDIRYDILQGTCEAEDLPESIRKACDCYDGMMYACEWPQ